MGKSGSMGWKRLARTGALALAALGMSAGGAAMAQIEQIDPNSAIDGDLEPAAQAKTGTAGDYDFGAEEMPGEPPLTGTDPVYAEPVVTTSEPSQAAAQATAAPAAAAAQGDTYKEDDLIGAAEGVFGKGAEGLARLIEGLLEKQGEPNAYIVGREGGGALILGVRYGSGTMFHKVEGEMPVYWTGPSVGFDVGANAGNTFVLVYNLWDTDELYERYPAGEGQAYFVGGFNASYLRKGDVVLIPIRVGAGLRLGVNAGYMKFSRKQRWLPF